MKKVCAVSGKEFEISAWEQEFIKKISPTFCGEKFEIPLPALCPEERMRRRTLHRNEQAFYRNVSSISGKQLISLYRPAKNIKVCSRDEWFSEAWDALEFGRDFNENKSFFDQFKDLQNQVPRAATVTLSNENCTFTTGTGYCKSCYLINCSEYCEDCMYGTLFQNSKDVVDSAYVYDSELCYECFNIEKCHGCVHAYQSQNCRDCFFVENLRSCNNCFLCTNLIQKQYYFMNQPCTKEEYKKKLDHFWAAPQNFKKALKMFADLREKRVHKYAQIRNCESSTGDFLTHSKNCLDCYDVSGSEDCRYVQVGVDCRDLLDCSNMYIKPELSYEVLGTIGTYNVHFCLFVFHSNDLWYCEQCFDCRDCFGCVGLRKKQYCIFNKEYSSKDAYGKEVARIISKMQETKEWGQYFPSFISPFAYNETVAQNYLPIDKSTAVSRGYDWHEEIDGASYTGPVYKIMSDIKSVNDDVLDAILTCEATGKNYRIVKPELAFYRKINLPIPRFCPDERHRRRMELRNPRKLWDRKCSECSIDIQTTYAPERPEKVLCEACYLKALH